MRYRPLGGSGLTVSAVSLQLSDAGERMPAESWRDLVLDAMAVGVNLFEIVGRDPAILDGLREALAQVERRYVVLALRLGLTPSPAGPVRNFSAQALTRVCQGVAARLGVDQLDLALLDDPGMDELPPAALTALKALRNEGRLRLLGVSGEGDAIELYLNTGAFDVLATPFSLLSSYVEKRRLLTAAERDMGVLGFDFWPEQLRPVDAPAPKRRLLGRAKPAATPGGAGYEFLNRTPHWTSEQICLASALTDTRVCSVQTDTRDAEHLAALAAAVDRELPAGVAAQVEMARFSMEATG